MTAEEAVPSCCSDKKPERHGLRLCRISLRPFALPLLSFPPLLSCLLQAPPPPDAIRIRDFLTASDAASLRFFATDYCEKLAKRGRPGLSSDPSPSFFSLSLFLLNTVLPCSRRIPISNVCVRACVCACSRVREEKEKKTETRGRLLKDNFARSHTMR